ncbi:hypothetical protein [Epilithonimonas hispanica]|uniref:Uncharacterized protein n=1 Tax=Epilithonimonas hispanica TaxID=358687 RepID=A0A3D9CMQ2_9FLAO|nr:hypothetical protein [Epilithonimonas hispanica]REC66939.1 hypothetical protein DRF58_16025 [Epilithonimonas hispanica]
MKDLNEIEILLLEGLTVKYPQFKSHIAYLKVTNRKLSNLGLDVQLDYENYSGEFDETNALFSNGKNIEIKGLKEGLSYVIDITAGQITSIEFSTYDEKWDGKITDFKIIEPD